MTKFILKRTEQQEIAEYAVLKDDFYFTFLDKVDLASETQIWRV